MIAAEWPARQLGDIFDIGAGKTMSAAARLGENKVPFLRTSNVLWDQLDLKDLDEMAMSAEELEGKSLEEGDLLVCEGGEIGRAAVWDGSVERVSFQNHLHRLRPKPHMVNRVVPRFYVFYLQSGFTQLGIFEGAGNTTTIPNLSRSRLAALDVPLPPITDQRAVVAVLGKVREAETLHGELRARAHELKRTVMEEVFRHGLSTEEQVESDIGLVPKSWIVEELGDSHTVQTGATPSRSNPRFWEGGSIPWVKTAEVSYSTIVETSEHITPAALEETTVKLLPTGTLLLAMYGQGVTRGKVAKLGIDATCNQACAAIRCTSDVVDPDYLYSFLEWQYESIRGRAHGGQQQNLSLDIVRGIPIVYPPDLHEQAEIASLFDAIDRKVRLHEASLAALGELFRRLLRDLMTAEVTPDQLVVPESVRGSAA